MPENSAPVPPSHNRPVLVGIFSLPVLVAIFCVVFSSLLIPGITSADIRGRSYFGREKLYTGGDLTIESVECSSDTLYPEQQNVPVGVTVTNWSDTTIVINMVQLYFSCLSQGDRNADYNVGGDQFPDAMILSGGSELFTLTVDVGKDALGDTTIYIDAYVVGQRMDDYEEIAISTSTAFVLDRFREISYGGDDGTASWSGDWQEITESDGPASGDVRVVDALVGEGYRLRIGRDVDFPPDCGIWRSLDLSGAESALLSFDFQRGPSSGFYGSSLLVQLSDDGGSSWNTVYTIGEGRDDIPNTTDIDITSYISVDTRIRFVTSGGGDGYVYLDNVQVEYSMGLGADSWFVLSDYINVIAALYYTRQTADRSDDSLMCVSVEEKFQLNSIYYLNSGFPLAAIPLDGSSYYRLVVQLNSTFDWDYKPDQSEHGYFALQDTARGFGTISSPQSGMNEFLLIESMVTDEGSDPVDFIAGLTKKRDPAVPWSMDTDPYLDPLVDSGKIGEIASIKESSGLSRNIIDCVDGTGSWDLTDEFEESRYYFYEMWFQPELGWSHGDMADLFLHLGGDQLDQQIDQLHLKFRLVDDDTLGPSFSGFEPGIVPEGTNVTISCMISDHSGVYDDETGSGGQGVYILWDTDGSIVDDCNEMQLDHIGGGRYETVDTLGSFVEGEEIVYRVLACDNDSDTGSSDRSCGSSDLQTIQIVGIVYLSDEPSTLNPRTVYRGQSDVVFTISLNNPMPDGIWIYTPSYLTFWSGGDTVRANVSNPTFLEGGSSAFPVGFEPVDIPGGLSAPDTLDVRLHLEGYYEGTAFPWSQNWKASATNRIMIREQRLLFMEHPVPNFCVHPGDTKIELLRIELVCESLEDIFLDSLTVNNVTTGLGEVSENDQNIRKLYLYRQRDDLSSEETEKEDQPERSEFTDSTGISMPSTPNDLPLYSRPFSQDDTLADAGVLDSGIVEFNLTEGRYIPAGGSVYYYVVADIDSFSACDGDSLDLCVSSEDSVHLSGNAVVSFEETPLNSEGKVAVDGSMSFQTKLAHVLPDTLFSGESNRPVLAVDIHGNGYNPDILNSLDLKNYGDASVSNVIDELHLWRDDGDSIFSYASDQCLGALQFTGSLYQVSGLSSAVTDSRRYFVTADFNGNFSNQLSVRFGIPVDGIGMNSDNDGPKDKDIVPASSQLLVRREVVSIEEEPFDQEPTFVHPGDRDVEIYAFRLENGTLESLTLDSLVVRGDSSVFECLPHIPVELYADDGDGEFDPVSDSKLVSSTWAVDRGVFEDIGFDVPAGSEELLFVSADLDSFITADGETLSITLQSADDIQFEFSTEIDYEIEGEFPLRRDGFITDGLMAHQIVIYPLSDSTISGNADNVPVVDLLLPGNGCHNDTLVGLSIINEGTAGADHIDKVKLWRDDGDSIFNSTEDDSLSYFAMSGSDTITFSELSVAIDGSAGLKVFATVDLREGYKTGATIMPGVPEMGIKVSSGNDGPIDRSVFSKSEIVIPPPDRITFYTSMLGDHRLYPGEGNVLNMVLGAYNSYSEPIILESIELYEVGSISPDELRGVSAFSDSDGDGLFDSEVDSFLVSTTSGTSRYTLGDLDLSLDPYRSSLLFITFDAVKRGIRDSVSVDFLISDESSIEFTQEGIMLQGEFPLNSAGEHLTDGMVSSQMDILGGGDVRVSPGDADIPCFSFRMPCNGTIPDSLIGVSLENSGSCMPGGDISSMKLWKESGGKEEVFDPGQEDLLTYLFWDGSRWKTTSPSILSGIPCEGLVMHVTVDVAESALDGRTIELSLPLQGIQVESGNDGPVDAYIDSPSVIQVTTDPLILFFDVPSSVTRGQEFDINITVSNVSDTVLKQVSPDSFSYSGGGSITEISGPQPASVDIPVGGDGIFEWSFRADSLGYIVFAGMAVEGEGEGESTKEYSDTMTIEEIPEGFYVTLSDLSPVSLNRGRDDVSLVEMVMSYGEGCTQCAPVKLDSLRFSVVDGSGAAVAVGDIASQVEIRDEDKVISSLSTSGWEENVIEFSELDTVQFSSGDSKTLKLAVDISDSAQASNFEIHLQSRDCLGLSDKNSGEGVDFDGAVFPWATNTVTIKSPATGLVIGREGGFPGVVNKGQEDVEAFKLNISNQGNNDGADISLSEIVLKIRNENGDTIPSSDVIRRFRLEDGTGFNVFNTEVPGTSASIHCRFEQELIISPQIPLSLNSIVDCLNEPGAGGISITLDDSVDVSARDINSGKTVEVLADTSSGTDFPMSSGVAAFRDPLGGLEVSGTGFMPDKVAPGVPNLEVLRVMLKHPGGSGESAALLWGTVLNTLNEQGDKISPDEFIDKIRITDGNDTLVTEYITSEYGSEIEMLFSDSVVVEAGMEDSLMIYVDLGSSAPPGYLQMHIYGNGICVADATDGTELSVLEGDFPISSGVTQIVPPPEGVVLAAEGLVPSNVTEGEIVEMMNMHFNLDEGVSGAEAEIEELAFEVLDEGNKLIPPGNVVDDIRIVESGNEVNTNFVFSQDHVTAVFGDPLRIDEGRSVDIRMDAKVKENNGVRIFSMRLSSASDVSCRDVTGGGFIAVEPAAGSSFPFSSGKAAILGRDMRSAFTNYPNPFVPSNENTRITYFLPQQGIVTLKVYTIDGRNVITLLDNELRNKGLHQDVLWDGRNGRGEKVINGVYFLVIKEKVNGREHQFRRKVSVVR